MGRTVSGLQADSNKYLPFTVNALLVAGACVLGYFPILNVGFLCDDLVILYSVTHGTLADIGSGGFYFRPLVLLSFALDRYLAGNEAVWFHFVNIVLHFVTSLSVAVLAQLLVKRRFAGLIAGLVFALHPAHPEAVTWIAGRYDVLCGAFMIWSMVCYIVRDDYGPGRSRVLRVLSLVLYALACLSKEHGFVLPLLILLYEFFPLHTPGRASSGRLGRVMPFLAVAAALFAFRWMVLGGFGGYFPEETNGNPVIRTLYHAFVQPFVILFVPVNWSLLEGTGVIWTVVTCAILLSPPAFALRARRDVLVFCVLAIIISVLPTVHLGVAGGALQNSRFLYIPSIFFALLIAELFISGFEGGFRKVAAALLVLFLLAMSLCLHQNNYPWQEAGRVVQSAGESIETNLANHRGEWGRSKTRILAFNVPSAYIGAWVFGNGLPAMLRLRHGEELEGVEIEVLYGGLQVEENIRRVEQEWDEGTVIWLFIDHSSTFVEYNPGE